MNETSDAASAPQRVALELAWAGVEIAFRGPRPFYERRIRPVVDLVAALPRAPGTEAPVPAAEDVAAATPAPAAEAAAPPPSTRTPIRVPAEPEGPIFRPASGEAFQGFAAKIGERANSPDRRVMAFAYYVCKIERQDAFTTDDAAGFFRTILEEPPEGLPEILRDLVRERGFLEAVGPAAPRPASEGWDYDDIEGALGGAPPPEPELAPASAAGSGQRWRIREKGAQFVRMRLLDEAPDLGLS